jgi:sarcosine oxidase subunit beta
MADHVRVVIVGGGVIGLATALHLVQSGEVQVSLLEAQHVGVGSSGRSVGIVETQYLDPFDIEMRVIGRRFVEGLAQDHGLRYTRNGYLRLAHNLDDLERYEASVETQKSFGIMDARVLDRAGLQRLIPEMRCEDRVGGLFGAGDGYVDGYLYTSLLRDIAVGKGVTVHQGTRLIGAEERRDGCLRISTNRDDFNADVVVNAAGPWAAAVGDLLGAPLPISNQRHQAVVVHLRSALAYVMPSVMDYVPGEGRDGLYFRHERADQLVAGLHNEQPIRDHEQGDAEAADLEVDWEFLSSVATLLSERLPGVGDAALGKGWAGLYPMSIDGQPIVGPHPYRTNVVCAAGAGGNGIQLSAAIGRLAAEWILHGTPSNPLSQSKWGAHRVVGF